MSAILTLCAAAASLLLPGSAPISRRAAMQQAAGAAVFAGVALPANAADDLLSITKLESAKGDLLGIKADAPPTYSFKGLAGAITGSDKPPPADLGVFGRGSNNDKTGRLNSCGVKSGCISTFNQADTEEYVPPWTYQDYSEAGASSFDSQREKLRAQARAERLEREAAEAAAAAKEAVAAGLPPPPPPPAAPSQTKTLEVAFGELKTAVESAGGKIQKAEDRYILAEFKADNGVVDDVEFLFSLDKPLVGYRSAPRAGNDDKRQRTRIRDLRKSLSAATNGGWKSVGRLNMD